MSRKFAFAGFAILILFVAASPRPVASNDGRKADPVQGGRFAGKYLAINLRSGGQNGGTPYLKNADLVTVGGRSFIVGEYATDVATEAPKEWKDVRVWMPVDEITFLLEMTYDQAVKIRPVAK